MPGTNALSTDPICFARDEDNDLIIPLRRASGLEAVLILCRTALLLWRDEWFLNRDIGTPWLETTDGVVTEQEAILGQVFDASKTQRILRKVLLGITGVTAIAELKTSFDGPTRNVTVSFVIRTRFGDSPTTSVAIAA